MNVTRVRRLVRARLWLRGALALAFVSCLPGHTAAAAPPAAEGDDAIASQHFPSRLIDESVEHSRRGGAEPFKAYTYLTADLEASGKSDLIVAAYTNGFSAAILVLRKRDGDVVIADEPRLRLLFGVFPSLQLLDLDADKRPEVIISFTSARGPAAAWVFKWNGNDLDLIGPAEVDEAGDPSTVLRDPDFEDLDGDGILEIINPPEMGSVRKRGVGIIGSAEVFKLEGKHYVRSGTLK
ncbi:MAG: VCBS repeat-containing protein [Acidobacteria bacterium]|nr:VCBS repeat-containing protein [Acidobacteriota bacterium]